MFFRLLKNTVIITLITLSLFEFSLRFLSSAFLLLRNPITLSQDNSLTILTVGESTTAYGFSRSYPRQLEKILEESLNHNVEVINISVPGTTTAELKRMLPLYLSKYKPDIVTFMTGINDLSQRERVENKKFLNNFVTYRLISEFFRPKDKTIESVHKAAKNDAEKKASTLSFISPNEDHLRSLSSHLKNQAFNDFNPTPYINNLSNQKMNELLAEYLYLCHIRSNKDCQKLYSALKNIPKIQSSDTFLLPYFHSSIALSDLIAIEEAGKLLMKNSPQNSRYIATILHNQFNETHGWKHWELTSYFYNQWTNFETDKDKKMDTLTQHIEFLITSASHSPFDIDIKKVKSVALENLESFEFANEPPLLDLKKRVLKLAGRKLTNIKLEEVEYDRIIGDSKTHRNQREMALLAQEFGAQVIVVQYPMLSADHLHKVYLGLPIIFVENQDNFVSAIKTNGFSSVFIDDFAKDFGHFTPIGHSMVAKRLANVILTQVETTQ